MRVIILHFHFNSVKSFSKIEANKTRQLNQTQLFHKLSNIYSFICNYKWLKIVVGTKSVLRYCNTTRFNVLHVYHVHFMLPLKYVGVAQYHPVEVWQIDIKLIISFRLILERPKFPSLTKHYSNMTSNIQSIQSNHDTYIRYWADWYMDNGYIADVYEKKTFTSLEFWMRAKLNCVTFFL